MRQSNKTVGNGFERELCTYLSENGFWAHCMAQNKQGQPFDVVASRNSKPYVIDAKVCSEDMFRLDRVEENQYSAMRLWRKLGNGDGWFALKMPDETVFMISLTDIEKAVVTKKTMYRADIEEVGLKLREWVLRCP